MSPASSSPHADFYPRSPCGERPGGAANGGTCCGISIHALLAESDTDRQEYVVKAVEFLSTLSLRRATWRARARSQPLRHFYPRSPCGERHLTGTTATSRGTFLSTLSLRRATPSGKMHYMGVFISIHALLAESDCKRKIIAAINEAFLSTRSS